MADKIRLNCMIPKVLSNKLHVMSADTGVAISSLVAVAIAEYFAKQEKEKPTA